MQLETDVIAGGLTKRCDLSSVAPSSSSPVATVVIVAIIVNFDARRAVAILIVVVVFVGHRRSLSLSPVAIVSIIFFQLRIK